MSVPLSTVSLGMNHCSGICQSPFRCSFIYSDPSPGIMQYQQRFVYRCNTDVQIGSVVVR
jgi:hypothetical protein